MDTGVGDIEAIDIESNGLACFFFGFSLGAGVIWVVLFRVFRGGAALPVAGAVSCPYQVEVKAI